MRKITGFGLLVMVTMLILFSPVSAADSDIIETNIEFQNLSFTKLMGYDLVTIADCDFMDIVGEPMLPVKGVFIVVPPDGEITGIDVIYHEKEEIEGNYTIFPAQPPVPLQNTSTNFTINSTIYNSTEEYPGRLFESTGEGYLRGYRILSIYRVPATVYSSRWETHLLSKYYAQCYIYNTH